MREGSKLKMNRITLKGEIILDKDKVGKIIEAEDLKFAFLQNGVGFSSKELRLMADLMEGKE